MNLHHCSSHPPVLPSPSTSTAGLLQDGHAAEPCRQCSKQGPQKTFWQQLVIFGLRATDSHSMHLNMLVFPSVLMSWSMLTLTSISAGCPTDAAPN